jgi:hypothetical protein
VGNKSNMPLEQLQAMDIKVLKAEKRALKIKLRRFEDEFIRINGQKPQSYNEVWTYLLDNLNPKPQTPNPKP